MSTSSFPRLARALSLGAVLLAAAGAAHATLILDDLNNGGGQGRYSGLQNGARNLIADEFVLDQPSRLNRYTVAGYSRTAFGAVINLATLTYSVDLWKADAAGVFQRYGSPDFIGSVVPTITPGFGTTNGYAVSTVSATLSGISSLQALSAGHYRITLEGNGAAFYHVTNSGGVANDYADGYVWSDWAPTTTAYGPTFSFGSQLDVTPVPEPSTWVALGLGVIAVRRRAHRRAARGRVSRLL